MLNKDIITKRLALIKYLYKIGVAQSIQAEPISSFSILSLHDSIEMYLKLLAEHLNIKSDSFNFLDYWTSIPSLTLKESMRNLNARRVNIKHKGLLPSKSDIEISRVNATDFFEQNTITQFGVNFNEISLFSLIQYDNVRERLEEAQKALDENRIENCIEVVAIAFDELTYSYENSKSSYYGHSPFYFGKDLTFLSAFSIGIGRDWDDKVGRKLGEFVDKVKDSLEGIQKAVKIMSFGIDYKKFVKFKLLTPIITRTMGGRHVAEVWGTKKWTKENCQYCIDFVLESSLKLQEFDFDINELIDNEVPTIILKEDKNTSS
jgi:hypothetical protein